MAHCEMCGTDMPVSGGRCALGHPVPGAAESAPPASAPLPVEALPAIPVVTPAVPVGPAPALPSLPVTLPPTPAPPQPPMPAASVPVEEPDVAPVPVFDTNPAGLVQVDAVVSDAPAMSQASTPTTVSDVAAPVEGALAVAPVTQAESVSPYAGPLVELVVAEEGKPRIPRSLGIFLSVLLVATAAGGWVVFGPGGGNALAAHYGRVYKVGEVHNYTMTVAMRGTVSMGPMNQPVDVSMNADVSERVLAVAPDKTSTVRFEVSFASMEANGQRMTIPAKVSITAHVAEDGRVLSVEGSEGMSAGGANPMSGFWGGPESLQPTFPHGKVAPGDTWISKTTQKLPFGGKSLTITSKNKLLRLGVEHGLKVAEIRSVLEVPMNFTFTAKDIQKMSALGGGGAVPGDAGMSFKGKMTFDGIQTVARDTGRPIAVTGDGVFDVEMNVSGPGVPDGMKMKMKMDMEISFAEIFGQAA